MPVTVRLATDDSLVDYDDGASYSVVGDTVVINAEDGTELIVYAKADIRGVAQSG